MARYRIVRRPSYADPRQVIFLVEERDFIWWKHVGLFLSMEGAEQRVAGLQEAERNPVEIKVVKEYN
jgi:hypothetical protein